MPRPIVRRLHLLRAALLGLLALAMVLQPVLAAAGDIHELGHDGEVATAGNADHQHDTGDTVPADDGKQGESLHFLLHFAHCCGHAPSALLGGLEVVAFTPVSDALVSTPAPLPLHHALQDVLRPPIRA